MEACQAGVNMKESTRIALLEQSMGHIGETLYRLDKRFDEIERRFDKVDKRFDKVEERFDRIEMKVEAVRTLSWSHFRWTIGAIVALFGSIITALIKGHIT